MNKLKTNTGSLRWDDEELGTSFEQYAKYPYGWHDGNPLKLSIETLKFITHEWVWQSGSFGKPCTYMFGATQCQNIIPTGSNHIRGSHLAQYCPRCKKIRRLETRRAYYWRQNNGKSKAPTIQY